MKGQRFAWAITGAGHTLAACAEQLLCYKNVDIFFSSAAKEVTQMYGLQDRFKTSKLRVYYERRASSPVVVRLFSGVYRVLVVAPATSNTVAKFVCGISDTLVTNFFAQAGKSRVPVIVFPTDLAPEMDTTGPHGEPAKVYPRPIDLENTDKLRKFPGVTVVESVEEMTRCLATYLSPEN
jgi:dihydromethanopterin reductase (acceptor)